MARARTVCDRAAEAGSVRIDIRWSNQGLWTRRLSRVTTITAAAPADAMPCTSGWGSRS